MQRPHLTQPADRTGLAELEWLELQLLLLLKLQLLLLLLLLLPPHAPAAPDSAQPDITSLTELALIEAIAADAAT